MKPERPILFNPGPVCMTETIRQAQCAPDICPREDAFCQLMTEIRQMACEVVHADFDKYDAVLFAGSGTLGQEVAVTSLVDKGETILMIVNGTYSSRAAQMCEIYGIDHEVYNVDILEQPDPKKVREYLEYNKNIKAVYMTHQESGTGILNPLKEVGEVAHEFGAIMISDTISSYGLVDIDMERDHVDCIIVGSQKGLWAPSGCVYTVVKREVVEKSKDYPVRGMYMNMYNQYKRLNASGEMQFTAPVQTMYAVHQALKELLEVGVEGRIAHTRKIYDKIRENVLELGFTEVLPFEKQSHLIVAVDYPENVGFDFKEFHDYLFERGFTLFPVPSGKPNSFRIGALGHIEERHVDMFFEEVRNYFNEKKIQLPLNQK